MRRSEIVIQTTGRLARRAMGLAVLAAVLGGCAVNPVTGQRELRIVSEAQEIALGEQNYLPMRQSQGGDYALDPGVEAYVQQVGTRLAAVSDRPLPYEFSVINNSVPNAWALPGGKIAINRGLLTELQSEAELAAVLGHEIVHAAAGHSANAMERAMLLQTGVLVAAIATSDSRYGQFATLGASLAAQVINQTYSRGAELEADRYGMNYMSRAGYDPQGAVDLQQTFVRLSEGRQTSWLEGLFASHPPSPDRVAANRATAAALPTGGETGADRYRAVMAATRQAEPAYEAHDAGRKALAAGDTRTAMARADEAIALEPREGQFHALRGDVHARNKDYARARQEYSAALARNDRFFYFHLQRGLVTERLGDDAEARRDLEASLELLPTAPAYMALGNIEQRAGNLDKARAYYRGAAAAEGEAGRQAYAALMRLDLAANPEQFLRQRSGLGADGSLLVQIDNPTPVAVRNIRLTIRYVAADGRIAQTSRRIRGTLAAGTSAQLDTGLGPFTSADQYQVAIQSAAVAE